MIEPTTKRGKSMKNKVLISISLTVSLSGCHGFKAGVFHDFNQTTVGADQVFRLDVPVYKNGRYECLYTHESKILSGKPFNKKDESALDMIGCMVEFK